MAIDKAPELSRNTFDAFIKNGVVLVDFFAEWCMPCIMMGPVIDEIAENMKGKVKFGKVNVGEHQDLAQRFDVSSVPNMVLFKDGKPVNRFVGSMSAEELEEKIRKHLR